MPSNLRQFVSFKKCKVSYSDLPVEVNGESHGGNISNTYDVKVHIRAGARGADPCGWEGNYTDQAPIEKRVSSSSSSSTFS